MAVNICLPCNIVSGIIYSIEYLHARNKEKKAFYDVMPALLDRQVAMGNLAPLQPAGGWITTDAGTQTPLTVYEDIRLALDYYRVPDEGRAAIGLYNKLTIRPAWKSPAGPVRSRIGRRWPPHLRETILRSNEYNPFLSHPSTVLRLHRQFLSMGLIRKAERAADGHAHLLLPRLLALAQLCGVDEGDLGLTDLQELLVHAHQYEKLARAMVAAVIGGDNLHRSAITTLALGNLMDGGTRSLGSVPLIKRGFAEKVPTMPGVQLVAVGVVRGGLMYPDSPEKLNNVQFRIRRSVGAKEEEVIYMEAGWAAALALRPPKSDDQPWEPVLRRDVHGSPLYRPWADTVHVQVKRLSDRRLVAKPSRFGFCFPPASSGQGVFGRPCGCRVSDRRKRIDLADEGEINGVNLSVSSKTSKFTGLRIDWTTGDVPMLLYNTDHFGDSSYRLTGYHGYGHSTYVQVRGECLHCAVNRALGTGCPILVAGGP